MSESRCRGQVRARGESACQNMFTKAANNCDERWLISERSDGFSSVGMIFCNISLQFYIIRHEEPR